MHHLREKCGLTLRSAFAGRPPTTQDCLSSLCAENLPDCKTNDLEPQARHLRLERVTARLYRTGPRPPSRTRSFRRVAMTVFSDIPCHGYA